MRTIKIFTAALLISLAGVTSAQSEQDAKACAKMAQAKAELLTKELALNDDQAAKVTELLAKNEESLVGMRGHCEVMDAKAKKADESTYASINELLDEKQQDRFKEIRESGKLESCGKEMGAKGCCSGGKKDADARGDGKTENVKKAQVKDAATLQRAEGRTKQ